MVTEKALALQGTSIEITPRDIVDGAVEQAKVLMDIVKKTKCSVEISGKKYLQVEAWQTIGTFNRTHAATSYTKPLERDGEIFAYEAKVDLLKDGEIIGSAIMQCGLDEFPCLGKEGSAKHKAAISAAQTWATSKAYRMNFSYIAVLAGYEPTPAEEMYSSATPQTEHWCEVHKTAFFKKGKMKWYAHPIGDTGQWCSEGQPKKQAPRGNAEEPDASQLETDMEFRKVVAGFQNQLGGKDFDLPNHLNHHFTVDKLGDLSPKQRNVLVNQLADLVAEKET